MMKMKFFIFIFLLIGAFYCFAYDSYPFSHTGKAHFYLNKSEYMELSEKFITNSALNSFSLQRNNEVEARFSNGEITFLQDEVLVNKLTKIEASLVKRLKKGLAFTYREIEIEGKKFHVGFILSESEQINLNLCGELEDTEMGQCFKPLSDGWYIKYMWITL
ncbi:hypothetical protein tinsulaeT_20950 [Thalassotalea insulae]|uniref:Uncharacterized protein n=1 Tax=Thalassotalea insulae TaxID=2056778 RepID=A0ABQ6GVM5_9GAMM|nr:hypothetical protein [Thalassotalea insulae]GLX78755.1 hypothetical protein tinsulaeT_20950 [Thalassotalea insulae]